jgi:elongation factor P--(R)-beta-lysine ligase
MEQSIQWRPTAPLSVLKKRADVFYQLREFFREKNVWEVDTPLLGHAGVSDPHIRNFVTNSHTSATPVRYLQTSPEYAMKRLLAAGCGSIYQMGKVFRDEACGAQHQCEFSLLEWYRVGWSEAELIEEVKSVVSIVLGEQSWTTITYRDLFDEVLHINPHKISIEELQKLAEHYIDIHGELVDKDQWLDLLFTHMIEPHLQKMGFVVITEYPASQAALSKIVKNAEGDFIGKRFEVYVNGLELANGYEELQDAQEQRARFSNDQLKRKNLHLPEATIDENLLAAMAAGLPDCSGVALGVDRLIMLSVGALHIAQVLPFGELG